MTPERLACDIWLVTLQPLLDPTNYAIHFPGRNRDIAIRAALQNADEHIEELATVVRWVLFMTLLEEEERTATLESRRVRAAATRLQNLLNRIEQRERLKR